MTDKVTVSIIKADIGSVCGHMAPHPAMMQAAKDILTDKQKSYAATDAWACIQIYNEIIRLKETRDYKLIIKAEDKNEASISEKG